MKQQGVEEPQRKGSQQVRKQQDVKSVFVQNVDYHSTKQQLQLIFQDCGEIQRITILKDKFTNTPKGCAYIQFKQLDAVQNALMLSGTKLRNRYIKIQPKRTNIKGMKNKINHSSLYGSNDIIMNMFNNFKRGRGRGK